MHYLVCFENDNVKNEENTNHIPRLGIGTWGRSKKNTSTALLKLSSAIKFKALNHRILLCTEFQQHSEADSVKNGGI